MDEDEDEDEDDEDEDDDDDDDDDDSVRLFLVLGCVGIWGDTCPWVRIWPIIAWTHLDSVPWYSTQCSTHRPQFITIRKNDGWGRMYYNIDSI